MNAFHVCTRGTIKQCALIAALCVVSAIASSQTSITYSPQAEEEFARAVRLYDNGEYRSSAAVFEKLAAASRLHQRSTAALIMLAKAQLHAGDLAAAERSARNFLTNFTFSSYRADAQYTLGLVYLRKQLPEPAVESLLAALDASPAPALESAIVVILDETINSSISLSFLEQLAARERSAQLREFLLIKLAEKFLASNDYEAASRTLSEVKTKYQRPVFSDRIAELESKLLAPRELKVGVILPLLQQSGGGGREKETAAGLLDGILLAEGEQSASSKLKVTADVRDTQRDNATVTKEMRSLAADPSVIGIVGPAFSTAAFAAAIVANEERLPLVTPTANATGLAATGPYVFQASPDLETRARGMAQHAVRTLRLKTLAVLSSTELGSKTLAEAFASEARALGAEIVTMEWYERGATDLTKQLTNVRRKANAAVREPFIAFSERMTQTDLAKLARLGVAKFMLDTLMATRSVVNAISLLGENAKEKLDQQGIPYLKGDPRVDSVQRVITALQGIYCPIASSSEIGVVASQLTYFNIKTRILGSGEWNNAAELAANRRYCRGVQFESDVFLDPQSPAVAAFSSAFFRKYNRLPNKLNLQGYNVMKLVLALVSRGAATREALRNALAAVTNEPTTDGHISFAGRRVNSWLHILEYADNVVQRVTEIDVQ